MIGYKNQHSTDRCFHWSAVGRLAWCSKRPVSKQGIGPELQFTVDAVVCPTTTPGRPYCFKHVRRSYTQTLSAPTATEHPRRSASLRNTLSRESIQTQHPAAIGKTLIASFKEFIRSAENVNAQSPQFVASDGNTALTAMVNLTVLPLGSSRPVTPSQIDRSIISVSLPFVSWF